MDKTTIKQILQDINLNFDIDTINQVLDFLLNEIGFIEQFQLELQIYGGAAIVSQIQQLPNIGKQGLSKNGIKIQNVMSHLGNLSKEKFLDTLSKQLEKWRRAPPQLKKRVQDVRYSYRFYKKYISTFMALFDQLIPNNYSKKEFSAMFWTLYLYVKNSYIQPQNIEESKTLLILLFRLVFENCLSKAHYDEIISIMKANIGQMLQITQQKANFYYGHLQNRLDHFYKKRHAVEDHINFNKLMNNPFIVERLVDDMSNEYARDQNILKYFNQIDQLSYLQLQKNMTPQVFRKPQAMDDIEPITTTLNFEEDDYDNDFQDHKSTPVKDPVYSNNSDQIPTPPCTYSDPKTISTTSPNTTPKFKQTIFPPPTPSIYLQSHALQTPLSKKIQNQNWVKRKITLANQSQIQQFKFKYESTHKKSYSQFQMQIKQIHMKIIKQFKSKSSHSDAQNKHKEMYSFFVSNCLDLEKQDIKIFECKQDQQDLLLKSVACLSSELLFYSIYSIKSQYKFHLDTFGISIMNAFKPLQLFINYISKSMPPDLKTYLKDTQKRLIVSQIWQNQQGYKILCQSQNPLNPNFNLFKKICNLIVNHSQKRVHEISRQVKIQRKIITKSLNMIKFILQNKPYLLKKNNIDQIILCCLMSCLSINQKHQQKTLQNIFKQYNSNIQYAYNSNQHGLQNNEGKEMGIVQFYNDVFLAQIQDMLSVKFDQLDDFLLTPVRIDVFNNKLETSFSSFNNYKQKTENIFSFNPQKSMRDALKEKRAKFLQKSRQNNNEMKQEKQEMEEDQISSPTFTLNRTITFGPNGQPN